MRFLQLPIFKNLYTRVLFALFVAIALFFALKIPILQAMGNYLINEDKPEKSRYLFVLSGGAYDRGRKAAELFKAGIADTIVLTGQNVASNLKALGITINEAQLTDSALVRFGVPQSNIILIPKGTSTLEEAGIIRDFCMQRGQLKAQVLSDRFHTGRAKKLIRPILKKEGIQLNMLGSPSSMYTEEIWWESENGLIMVNNEYAKVFYYLIK